MRVPNIKKQWFYHLALSLSLIFTYESTFTKSFLYSVNKCEVA